MTLTKNVNGKKVVLSQEEEILVREGWAKHDAFRAQKKKEIADKLKVKQECILEISQKLSLPLENVKALFE